MKRRNGSGRFASYSSAGEDINPMDGVSNLADVMLVFACGLMLALITFWNVDVGGIKEGTIDPDQGQEITEDVSGLGNSGAEAVDGEGLEQYGTVFRDPTTGKLYMVTEEGE